VNLAGLLVSDVERGDVLVREGTLHASTLLDVEMTLLLSARGLDDGDRVRVHAGSAEVLARVRLLGARTLAPGEKGLAQLRLEGPTVAVPGDRLVLRSYSPAETVGGARVLDPQPPRRRKGDEAFVRCLADAPNVSSLATLMVHEGGREGVATSSLAARLGVPLGDLDQILNEAEDIVRVGAPAVLVDQGALTLLARNAEATLARFHAKEPLKAGMPREELRERCFARVPDSLFARVLTDLEALGGLRMTPTTVALASHEVRLTAGEAAVREALLVAVTAAGLQGVETGQVGRPNAGSDALIQRVVRVVVAEGSVVRIGGDLLVSRDALARLVETVRRRFPPGSLLDVGAFKDATGLSRKYAIPLLEFLDRERVTRRSGESRLVLSP
jgi:selenocysteine-specific elongation factor